MIVQKCRRFDVERFGHMPERNDGDILLAALHRAYMRAVNAHSVRQGGLAEASFLSKKLQVCAKYFPNIHPPVKCGSRILMRRTIILGTEAGLPALSQTDLEISTDRRLRRLCFPVH